jgi:two-component system chemotaxis response regulator CheB
MSGTRHSDASCPFGAVVVVGSQGALESFSVMLSCIPADFPAAVVFDLHRSERLGLTERVLGRRCSLPVRPAEEGLALDPAQVYLAPQDRQLLLGKAGRMSVLPATDRLGHPFADALLASAARVLGRRLIGVVLSGRLAGGARGVREVKRYGGRVIVEDPQTAVAPSMPNAALATGCVDFALPPERLGHALLVLCVATGAAELFRVRLNPGVAS